MEIIEGPPPEIRPGDGQKGEPKGEGKVGQSSGLDMVKGVNVSLGDHGHDKSRKSVEGCLEKGMAAALHHFCLNND